ncbi:MAG: hypothetical protein K8U03_09160 [Planctomycetia bacterium]|nr:hypothetical protein [Planctomycetia bacterium]
MRKAPSDLGKFRLDDAEFDALAENCREFIDRGLDGANESLCPQTLIKVASFNNPAEKPVVEVSVLYGPFNTPDEKRLAMSIVGGNLACGERVPLAVFLLSEAWHAVESADGSRKYADLGDDPNRIEVVTYQGLTNDGRKRHGSRAVRRDAANKMHAGGAWEITPNENVLDLRLPKMVYLSLAAKVLIGNALARGDNMEKAREEFCR